MIQSSFSGFMLFKCRWAILSPKKGVLGRFGRASHFRVWYKRKVKLKAQTIPWVKMIKVFSSKRCDEKYIVCTLLDCLRAYMELFRAVNSLVTFKTLKTSIGRNNKKAGVYLKTGRRVGSTANESVEKLGYCKLFWLWGRIKNSKYISFLIFLK